MAYVISTLKLRNERNDVGSLFQRRTFSGGDSGGVTPDPIPNSAVKPSSADGTIESLYGRVGRCRILLFNESPNFIKILGLSLFVGDVRDYNTCRYYPRRVLLTIYLTPNSFSLGTGIIL
jgi:hypothetical protein